MGILLERIADSSARDTLIDDCARLVDDEVANKRGVTGMMIKGGYKAFKALKPGIVKEALKHLVDDFAAVLDKHHGEFVASGASSFDSWVKGRERRIADDLLGVTDGIMARSDKAALKKIYNGLRGVAEKNVAEAVPGVARIVTKHTS